MRIWRFYCIGHLFLGLTLLLSCRNGKVGDVNTSDFHLLIRESKTPLLSARVARIQGDLLRFEELQIVTKNGDSRALHGRVLVICSENIFKVLAPFIGMNDPRLNLPDNVPGTSVPVIRPGGPFSLEQAETITLCHINESGEISKKESGLVKQYEFSAQ